MLGRQISERGLQLETVPHRKKGLRERTGTLWGKARAPLGWVGLWRRWGVGNIPPEGERMDGRTPRLLPSLEVSVGFAAVTPIVCSQTHSWTWLEGRR